MLLHLLFPWPCSGPPTFFILESPLIQPKQEWSRSQKFPTPYTRDEHGQDQDWISCGILANFRIRIGFVYLFLKNIGSGQDQDISLISITKFL